MENEFLKSIRKVIENETGTVYVADEVFTTIVGNVTTEVEGVLGLSDLNTGELISKVSGKTLLRALRFDFSDDAMTVLVGVIVETGSNLLKVSRAIQDKIATAVGSYIGYPIGRINIQISDVRSK